MVGITKEFWFASPNKEARQRWQEYLNLDLSSGLAPVLQFAKRLYAYSR